MNQYIHFTSFENFNCMLENNKFRFYSFSNLTDVNELDLPLILIIHNLLNKLEKNDDIRINEYSSAILHLSLMILINNENIFKSNLSKEIYKNTIQNSSYLNKLKISKINLNKIKNIIKLPNHFFVGSFNLIYDYELKKTYSNNLRQNIRFNTMWDYYGRGHSGVGLVFENDVKNDKLYVENFEMSFKPLNYILDSQQSNYKTFDDFIKTFNNKEIVQLSDKLLNEFILKGENTICDFDKLMQEINLLEKNNFSLSLENIIKNDYKNIFEVLKYSFEIIKLIIEKSLLIKEKKYEHEKEMRLVLENPFLDFNVNDIKIDFTKQSSYIEIGLTKLLNNKFDFNIGKKTKIVLGEKNPLQTNVSLRYLYEQKYNLEFLNIIE